MEEPSLVRQLLDPEPDEGLSPGERRGFGCVPWGRLDMILVSVLAIVSQIVLAPMGLAAVANMGLGTSADASLDFFVQVIFLYSLLVSSIWLVGVRRHGASWESLGFRPVDLRSLAGLLGLLATVIIVANIAVRSIAHLGLAQDPFIFGHQPRQALLMAVLILVAAPFAEEVFFRGFLLQGLARRMRFWPAAVITSGIFALAHVWPYLYVPIFILGLALAWLFWRTGSIWASVAAHATINATSLVVVAVLYSR